jgi:heme/copper-type cytochrome/quinol oxidase subunit 4
MNPTDILLSIAIVGIYTLIYVYLKSKYDENKTIISLFFFGFVYATIITGILYYLIKFIAS